MTPDNTPASVAVVQSDAEFLRDLAQRLFQKATPAMGFDQGDVDQCYAIANRLAFQLPGGVYLRMFADDVEDVQSPIVIVHQLRASADIQDGETKRQTGWADTNDRATLMRKAADTIEAFAAAPAPDAALRGALEPFATFAATFVDNEGWTGPMNQERIVDWFGPSDFRRAAALAATPSQKQGEGL